MKTILRPQTAGPAGTRESLAPLGGQGVGNPFGGTFEQFLTRVVRGQLAH